MYVIQRVDKEYGDFTTIHKTLEEAEIEANRLATKHVIDNPEFIIFELLKVKAIRSTIVITSGKF